jgi:hypothetical protein
MAKKGVLSAIDEPQPKEDGKETQMFEELAAWSRGRWLAGQHDAADQIMERAVKAAAADEDYADGIVVRDEETGELHVVDEDDNVLERPTEDDRKAAKETGGKAKAKAKTGGKKK